MTKVVFFHSGSQPTYRKVNKSGGGKGSFTSIPTVDITRIDSPDIEDRKHIAKEVYDACTTTGFFYVSGHGVTPEEQKDIFDTIKRFFHLDLDAKMKSHAHKNAAMRGYEPMLETQLDPRTKGGRSIVRQARSENLRLADGIRCEGSLLDGRLCH